MDLAPFAEAVRLGAFVLVGAAVVLVYLSHQRSRATIFADLMLKATLLLMAAFYLGFVADNMHVLPGDPEWYHIAVNVGYLLVGGFFVVSAYHLWQLTRKTGVVIVTPDVLNGLRTRTARMYGESASRFIVYAVGKESAQKAAAKVFGADLDAETIWKRLPGWFRLMGYGQLEVDETRPGAEVRLRVRDTFESREAGGAHGCELTRGYLAGLGTALHPELDCECVETRCSRDHGGSCEFQLHWFPKVEEPTKTVAVPQVE